MLSVSTTFGLANTSPNGISNSDDAQLDLSVSKEGADIPSNSTLAVSSVPVHDTKNVTVNTAVFSAQGHTPSGGLSEEELLLHLHVQRKRLATRKTLAARLLTAQHTPSVEAVYEAAKDELDDVNRRIESLVESHKALATRERPQLAALIKTIEAGPMCLPTSPTSPASPTLNTGPTHRHLNQGRNRYSPTNNRTGNNGQEAMKPTHRKVPPYNCDRCGKNYTHNSTDCKQCTKCMKMGHFAEDCRIPRKANNQKNQGSGPFSKPQHSG